MPQTLIYTQITTEKVSVKTDFLVDLFQWNINHLETTEKCNVIDSAGLL